jgi:6-hydroxycyclohex-1-ene-1-carbonyl-CoA dehydrogenase
MAAARNGTWEAWLMTAPQAALERREFPGAVPGPGEAVIEVAGCGLCHTDLSFLYQGVKTRSALPLVLGHEISGTVRLLGPGVDATLLGKPVIVPAVLPCGECELCLAGRRSICRLQVMPGNDRHGGFASHVVVPARFLCRVPDEVLAHHQLWELAVVSDAMSTPFQAVRRSELAAGEVAIVVGVGGIGLHLVQVAAAVGAIVIALDVDDRRLEQARRAGAHAWLNVREIPLKERRKQVKAEAERLGGPAYLWKIFETSGTAAGQETAYALIGFGGALAVVGYTMDKVEICLSNLMAYDAVARGNWGADPLLYPELLAWIGAGRIQVTPYVERHALGRINEVIAEAHHGRLLKRAVLVP